MSTFRLHDPVLGSHSHRAPARHRCAPFLEKDCGFSPFSFTSSLSDKKVLMAFDGTLGIIRITMSFFFCHPRLNFNLNMVYLKTPYPDWSVQPLRCQMHGYV